MGNHHEIYISDFRLRTAIRQPSTSDPPDEFASFLTPPSQHTEA